MSSRGRSCQSLTTDYNTNVFNFISLLSLSLPLPTSQQSVITSRSLYTFVTTPPLVIRNSVPCPLHLHPLPLYLLTDLALTDHLDIVSLLSTQADQVSTLDTDDLPPPCSSPSPALM